MYPKREPLLHASGRAAIFLRTKNLNHVTPEATETAVVDAHDTTVTVVSAVLPQHPTAKVANTNASDEQAESQGAFASFGLAPQLQRALDAAGYVDATPIQVGAIPALLQNRDMLGIAQTGTGKTAAFALPILHRLATTPYQLTPKGTRALILAPTRELVVQIAESFRTYGKFVRMKSCAVFGGVSEMHQIKAMLGGVDVLVATPGRLLDLVQRRHISLAGVQTFVLDEADRMLDMGFIRDINKIVAMIPTERQSLLFSATMPKEIAHLAAKLLRDPVRVEVTPQVVTVDRIAQKVFFVEGNQKRALLVSLLQDPSLSRVVVFTRTKHVANRVSDHLAASGISTDAIHGNKSQNARQKALDNFKKGHVRVLVATDIAARGIHVSDISHVINYELPNIPESYVHRIGRTARAGAEGIAFSFCDRSERSYLRDIERFAKTTLTVSDHAFTGPSAGGSGDNDRGERPERNSRGPGGRGGRNERPRSDRGGHGHGHGDRGGRGQGERKFNNEPRRPHNNEDTPRRDHAPISERNESVRMQGERKIVERPARQETDEPLNRSEANLSHAERYFGGGRSPTRDGAKRHDGFRAEGDQPREHREHKAHGDRTKGDRPQGAKKHGGKPFGKPHGKPHGQAHGDQHRSDKPRKVGADGERTHQSGERPMRRPHNQGA